MKFKYWFNPLILLTVFFLRWQLLQLIAWGTMLIRYSFEEGLAQGWRMTFDGNHPCAICHAVSSGSQAEAAVLGALASHPSLLLLPAALILFSINIVCRTNRICHEKFAN